MTRDEPIPGDPQPTRSVDRRGLFRGLGAVLGGTLLAGCQQTLDQSITEEATPVGISPDVRGEAGFAFDEKQKFTVERS